MKKRIVIEAMPLLSIPQLCERFSCSDEARALAGENPAPSACIPALREAFLGQDAVHLLARLMPKDMAVCWAAACVRQTFECYQCSADEQAALAAAEVWAAAPGEESAIAAGEAAAEKPTAYPAVCVAHAAAFSAPQKIQMPAGQDLPPSPVDDEDLSFHFTAAAILLAAAIRVHKGGIPADQSLDPFFDAGLSMAQTLPGWG